MRRTTVSEMAFIVVLRLEIEAEQICGNSCYPPVTLIYKSKENRPLHLRNKRKPFLQIVHR